MNHVRWGIIGCGNVVQTKTGPLFARVRRSSIEAISRRDPSAAQTCANALGAKKYYTDYRDLIKDCDVDAVYIATPPGLHLEQALFCAQSRKPLYLEKPFARNYMECEKIVDAFRSANTPVYAAHYRRAHPKFLKIRRLLKERIIGDIYTCECSLSRRFVDSQHREWMFKPRLSGGGKFFDISPHMIDIIIFLLGKMIDVRAYCRNVNGTHSLEEIVVAIFHLDSNVLGTINYNLSTDAKEDKVILRGSKGRIDFSIHGSSPILVTRNGVTDDVDATNHIRIEEPMIEAVVDDLVNGSPNVCYGVDALETYKAIDMILGEFYHGRDRDFWRDFDETTN